MRIYIAGRYDRRVELNERAAELRAAGYTVDCRWLTGAHQLHPNASGIDLAAEQVPMEARPFAEDDIEDICKSDVLILFSEPPNSHSKRGGRHVEFGIALALGKEVIVVGPRENVFHCLTHVTRFFSEIRVFETWAECLAFLTPHVEVVEDRDQAEKQR